MKKPKHTDGPWKVGRIEETPTHKFAFIEEVEQVGIRSPLAKCHPNDAALIASAPMMLETLETLLGALDGVDLDHNSEPCQKDVNDAYCAAELAIKKARGE